MVDADLTDLAAFAAVAEQRSFRRAANLRNGSASTFSTSVRRLEERLGVRLLHRTTRSVTLTEAGEELFASLRPALAEIGRALDVVGGSVASPRGTLRLNVPVGVSELILPALLARFAMRYPEIRVDVTADDSFVDILAGGFDAGIRYDERLEQDMIAVPIGPRHDRYVTVASPDYLARHGVPEHPHDLLRHRAVRHRFASGRMGEWEYEKDGETIIVSPPAHFVTNRMPLLLAAVEAGVGLFGGFEAYVAPGIARGTMVEVLADWSTRFSGPFLYFAGRRLMPVPLRAFVDFLREEANHS
ncbi:LysR family transcriptional regulator [Sphingomonas sp. GC_Shp_3]|uniref:LysR family transcriptional regulator n=1 Tax=Sphingomonas sp. GC_Shp_3 TaxID=2937383 RepID=UPI00226ABEEB|nr:LysR family transcriptional regulator [Sphingomonas sp. GC_Shp_3]